MSAEEHILVIPRALFDELGAFQGFCAEASRYLDAILAPGANFFLPRGPAETDPNEGDIMVTAVGALYAIGRLKADRETQEPLGWKQNRDEALRAACARAGTAHRVFCTHVGVTRLS